MPSKLTIEFGGDQRPTIVCICGSMRFHKEMIAAAKTETLVGNIVLLPVVACVEGMLSQFPPNPKLKEELDELHLRKIDLSDEVLIINIGGYLGESTKNEWAYAVRMQKRIRWYE